MSKNSKRIPISAFARDAAGVIHDLRASDEPVMLTEEGEASALLMSIDAYRRSEASRELLLALARGERDIATGRGPSLDEVMAEIDAIIEEEEA